jgi:hypothetical protein
LLFHHDNEASGGDKNSMLEVVSLLKMISHMLQRRDLSFSTATKVVSTSRITAQPSQKGDQDAYLELSVGKLEIAILVGALPSNGQSAPAHSKSNHHFFVLITTEHAR